MNLTLFILTHSMMETNLEGVHLRELMALEGSLPN